MNLLNLVLPLAAMLAFTGAHAQPVTVAPTTTPFTIEPGGHTTVEIFNVLGQKLRTLADQDLGAGSYRMPWDGRDDSGQRVSRGMYFVRIISPDVQQTTRIVLAR